MSSDSAPTAATAPAAFASEAAARPLQLRHAHLDAANVLVVALTHPVERARLEGGAVRVIAAGRHIFPGSIDPYGGGWPAAQVRLTFTSSLPTEEGALELRLEGRPERVIPIPRGTLLDAPAYQALDARLGAHCTPERTEFALFAPTANAAHVALYTRHRGPEGRREVSMQRAAQGVWTAAVEGDLHGLYYMYRLEGPDFDGVREAIDPYARCASNRDGRGLVVDLARTNPPGFDPRARPPQPNENGIVVYEAHVRDFTIHPQSGIAHRGKFLGLAERGACLAGHPDVATGLDHLVELGVSHVQLLPIYDFANDEEVDIYDWGYMPANFNSPDGWYATDPHDVSRIVELKALIGALHAAGIRVVMDVVYNHTDISASFDAVCPGYYYRRLPDGSYSNGSGCGNEFRSEAPMARKFILESCRYWVEEFGVDGFRFDLMGLIDRTTMLALREELHAIDRSLLLWGEPWTAGAHRNPEPVDHHVLRGTGISSFNDKIRDLVKGPTRGPGGGFVQTGNGADALMAQIAGAIDAQAFRPTEPLNYVSAHDDNVLWDKIVNSTPGLDDAERAKMHMMCAAILLTAQGKVFLHGGDEMLRTKKGVENSYNAPDAINQIDYAWKRAHRDVFDYHRGLIALRRAHPVFHLTGRGEIGMRLAFDAQRPTGKAIAFTLDAHGIPGETWRKVRVIHNADAQGFEFSLPPGEWDIVAHEGRAGHESLGKASGRIAVGPRRSAVLWQ